MPTLKKKIVRKVSSPSEKKIIGKQRLVSAEGYSCFWVNNGPVLRNLFDLKSALSKMNDKQFAHHVSKSKNDFAIWTQQVLKDPSCASLLQKAKNQKEALTAVTKHLEAFA